MFPTTAGKRWFLLDVVVTFVLARTNSFFSLSNLFALWLKPIHPVW
jgi:hypothetical protein